jgi:hypothetical protein
MNSLFRFEFGESRKDQKIFWPSSIAVLDLQPQKKTHHNTPSEPSTVWESVNKQAKMVRVLQYLWRRCAKHKISGLISWSSPPGGGTTDYAVDIFHKAHTIKIRVFLVIRN